MITQQDIADHSHAAALADNRALAEARAAQVDGLLLELRGLEAKSQACQLLADCFARAGQPGFAEELRKAKLQVAPAEQLFEAFASWEVELSAQEELLESLPLL